MNKDMIIKLRKMGTYVNILYVEDDEEVSEQFENLFRKVFKNLDVVSDGEEGLQKYKEELHDIVITDIEMPNMDGIALIKEIRSINPDQLIVVTSAYNSSKYLQELIEHGVDKFILKPFDMSKLFRDIARIVSIMYSKKREKQLQEQLQEKTALNQLLLDKMSTPLVVINAERIHYKNEKFDELFRLKCDIESEGCYLSTIFESEKISKLNHVDFLEYMKLYTTQKHLYMKNGEVERFKVITSPLEGTLNTLVSFINTEVISQELDKLKSEARLDTLTHLSTRESFFEQLDAILDSSQEYYTFCFGLKHLKEFIRIFGVGNIRDIYKTLGKNLQLYFKTELTQEKLSIYFFDTNHFVVLLRYEDREKIKEMLKEFGDKYQYTTKMAKTYEAMSLDILGVKLNDKLTVEENITEIENQLYMLNGEF